MRTTILANLFFVLCASTSFAQRVGDTVVVMHDKTPLTVENKVLQQIDRGISFEVEAVNGEWLWVSHRTTGWINNKYVTTPSHAIKVFAEQIRRNPKDSSAYNARGRAYQANGDVDSAIGDYDEALRLNPNYSAAFRGRGFAWMTKKDVDQAILDFGKAISIDPKDADSYGYRAFCWTEQKDYDKALVDFSKAINIDPRDVYSLSNRALCWFDKEEYDRAITDFNQAIKIKPKDAYSFSQRALCWYEKKEFDKAISDFSAAIKIDPRDVYSYGVRASCWIEKNEYGKAIADLDEAINIDPKNSVSFSDRARCWAEKHEHEKALSDYTEAFRLDATNTYASVPLAWHLATCANDKHRDGKRAVELATTACESSSWHDACCLLALAVACAESGDFDNAVKWSEEFLGLASDRQKKQWGFLLGLFKSGKPYREKPTEKWFGIRISEAL
jgi:tetratricopeptide (TPR) repeat protein